MHNNTDGIFNNLVVFVIQVVQGIIQFRWCSCWRRNISNSFFRSKTPRFHPKPGVMGKVW